MLWMNYKLDWFAKANSIYSWLYLFITWKGWILKGSNLSIEWLRDITNFRAGSSKVTWSVFCLRQKNQGYV
uniref:Uncharacterized protein n=1 Tax=Rhizoctonia solani TaxID=456999 RepID=N0A359_9AGAM|nr:hypothetical protein RSOL_m00520 [Rhizoctonia solani]AGK45386.1 hypothetical protein RSOL_m00520 [Rhizoctonia solani]